MNYNYHTHTYLCGHASGTPEEYVLHAIENGIKYMGFSDHIPFMFPDGFESGHRVPMDKAEEYVKMIASLREKYKDKIEIKIGFETEYYPEHFDKMVENAISFGAEYLILGQHYLYNEKRPNPVCSMAIIEDEQHLFEYVQTVIDAMHTGVFTYIAHPDCLYFVGDEKLYRDEMRKICIASRELNIPLEINCLGIRNNRKYPNMIFWEMAGEESSPVTFGFDAHDAPASYDAESIPVAKAIVEKYSLNYIGKPEIVNIQHKNKLI